MAGLSLYFEDGHDDLDDFGFDDYGSECDGIRITAFLDAGQDNLTPLGRLEKYAFSENVFNRQIVARGLLDVLREFSDNENDFISVMETVARMSEDGEPTVRAELMEQVPNIAMFLHESQPNFPAAFSRYLVPIVVHYLTDPNNQVRKTSQAALLVLLEQGLICKGDMETKVCPVLLDLTESSSDDDYKIEAVAIMCKLVTMLSKETVEQLLQRFCELCSDARLFQVRKVCAANFGEFCSIVGRDATEKLLMSKFFDLCSDSLWGIRKACADCFMIVSNSTSPEVRRTKLSPLFSSLISDQSRWVRQAAFQSLGRFISTFANPSTTGLYFKEDGTLLEVPRCPFDSNSPLCIESSNGPTVRPSHTPINQDGRSTPSLESMSRGDSDSRHTPLQNQPEGQARNNNLPPTNNKNKETEQTDQNFNSFLYWRPPLADISQELEMLKGQGPRTRTEGEKKEVVVEDRKMSSLEPATCSQIQKVLDCLQPHMDDPDVQAQVQVLSAALKAAQLESQSEEEGESESQTPEDGKPDDESSQNRVITEGRQTPEPPTQQARDPAPTEEQKEKEAKAETEKEPELHESPPNSPVLVRDDSDHSSVESELMESLEGKEDSAFNQVCEEKSKAQNVIPQQLLDQYLSMTDPAQAQTVDTEIAKHCAFSLPGVALTLGRQNWHCLKDTYETLATDVQWKVRRTLAFSIHDLALILGDQLTAADLVPIFNGFLKDLDEVRIGVLKHLYDFLKLLHAENRREYLYQLQEFMVTDNSRNWRFRYQLAGQLILIMELYSHDDVYNYLRQIALTLCSDKVSEVRWISYQLVVEILQKMYACGARELGLNFINELIVRFCHCPKWVGRQAFAFICQAIVEEDCMPMDQFAQHLLPSLLSLSLDPVANVRVLVAKAMRQSVMEKAYFKEPGSAYLEELEETVMTLQADKDRDVRFFASLDPNMMLMDTSALI
ncbi:serine/threonine-protein phosphatase 4 regulatory subunit 1 isoform X2 [Salmo salar]|uniref:Serine/threonine-protein phosphatase 4 regulatory subunit 1 isoform X2 n=1 Tax=Salmo salar TaxID=8030 RepID=A0A1S3P7T9_SALSA|nr:serine/threonine-protein phosphatase 4 regulatory subunit 1-like isoform X2 [Salmo salar]